MTDRLLIFWEDGFTSRALPSNGSLSIGRSAGCDVAIDHPSVSRKHATLHLDGEVRIEDLGSSNGTRVAGTELPKKGLAPVARGDICEVGSVILVIEHPASIGTISIAPPSAIPTLTSPIISPAQTVMIPPPPPEEEGPLAALDRLVGLVARGSVSVLLVGESGVGKEVTAEKIHGFSGRALGPFVRISAAGMSEKLLDRILFGFEKGAFPGAKEASAGVLESADKGTFFFDEITDLSLRTQDKLLRVLDTGQVQRAGAPASRPLDVRIIAATIHDLRAEATAGRFREELFLRLGGITLRIPPLRERTAEIAGLARLFIARTCRVTGRSDTMLTSAAVERLTRHRWPGNIRELETVIERVLRLVPGERIDAAHLPIDLEEEEEEEPTDLSSPRPSTELRKEVEEFDRAKRPTK
ncbi:MAG: sigma 54-interacting transcriptional regulator [Polyangiaceae bacterium]